MGKTPRIKTLFAPPADLSTFDPGQYADTWEFTNPTVPLDEHNLDALAQMVFFCDYLALEAGSPHRQDSIVRADTTFFTVLRTNLARFDGWDEVEVIIEQQGYLYFVDLVHFLFRFFQPHRPK